MNLKINQNYLLITLSVLLVVGIGFSVVQIVKAGITGPHNPGHTWATLDKPANCSSGTFVYGLDDSGLLCTTPSFQSTGLYGYCHEYYDGGWTCNTIYLKPPAICASFSNCGCSSGFTLVQTGGEDQSFAGHGEYLRYSCYKN